MFEKEAEEWVNKEYDNSYYPDCNYSAKRDAEQAYQSGTEFGYNKANEWYRVSDKLPEMDVLVYLWKKGRDFPLVARRHISYGQKEWVWDCMWGSGFIVSQLKGKDYLWKEIVLPKE